MSWPLLSLFTYQTNITAIDFTKYFPDCNRMYTIKITKNTAQGWSLYQNGSDPCISQPNHRVENRQLKIQYNIRARPECFFYSPCDSGGATALYR